MEESFDDLRSEKSQILNIQSENQQAVESSDERAVNKDLTNITAAVEMIMPRYSAYNTVTNLDIMDTNVKKRADIRDVKIDDAQEDMAPHVLAEVNENGEVNILRNADEVIDRTTDDYYASKEFVKNKVRTKSHRWGKTKKDRMKTSVKKLRGVSTKIADLKRKQADTKKILTREESLAAYEELYAEIHSADRYYAEGMSSTELEEKYIKLQSDINYAKNMIILYMREKDYAEAKADEIQKRIDERKAGEETAHQIEADQKDLEYWKKRERVYTDKMSAFSIQVKGAEKKVSQMIARA